VDTASDAHQRAVEVATTAVDELRRALDSAREIHGREHLDARAEQFEIEAEIELGLAEARLRELEARQAPGPVSETLRE
jgi:hypothetical protein